MLAVSVYNHYKRILSAEKTDVELQKSNVLLLALPAWARRCWPKRWPKC
ncbi:MAG: hypothetical protein ACLRWF_04695 [Ruthenibacterium sp.]